MVHFEHCPNPQSSHPCSICSLIPWHNWAALRFFCRSHPFCWRPRHSCDQRWTRSSCQWPFPSTGHFQIWPWEFTPHTTWSSTSSCFRTLYNKCNLTSCVTSNKLIAIGLLSPVHVSINQRDFTYFLLLTSYLLLLVFTYSMSAHPSTLGSATNKRSRRARRRQRIGLNTALATRGFDRFLSVSLGMHFSYLVDTFG